VFYHVESLDGEVWSSVASLDMTGTDKPRMTFDLTRNGEPTRLFAEVPAEIIAVHGEFIRHVQDWEQGGELHESLRHND
jgi:hypothetical protein